MSVGEGEEDKILEVYQKGYCLGPRVSKAFESEGRHEAGDDKYRVR